MIRLCTICARGGSKGVKNKNIRQLMDKPLIAHSIAQAKSSGIFDLVAISSDSEQILKVGEEWGADILIKRPDILATDQAAKLPVIQHCLKEVEKITGQFYDTVVDLDATSPLRIIEDIIGAVDLLEKRRVSNVITGMPSRRSPYFNLVEINQNGYVELSKTLSQPIVRRQDAPVCYDMNASIYVWNREVLLSNDKLFMPDTLLYAMPEERSIDIDSELDYDLVELIMKRRIKNNESLI
jgi:CMP-N,N'-diacetyllegionaminic acid synthase